MEKCYLHYMYHGSRIFEHLTYTYNFVLRIIGFFDHLSKTIML